MGNKVLMKLDFSISIELELEWNFNLKMWHLKCSDIFWNEVVKLWWEDGKIEYEDLENDNLKTPMTYHPL